MVYNEQVLLGIEISRLKRILGLALPIIAGMLSQNVLNLIDTAMVGRLGPEALAAVGISSMVAFLFLAPMLGIASGVQAISARKKGEGNESQTAYSLNDSLVFSLVFSVLVLALGFWLAEPLFAVLTKTQEVGVLAKDYFLIRISVCFFAVMNYAFRGYWNSVDLSKVYMKTLIVMHLINIVFNYLLIFGKFGFPRMETNGAALATAFSVVVGFVLYFVQALRLARPNGFMQCLPCLKGFKTLTKLSLPAGFELAITMSNVVALYWLVGQIGTEELAGINVLMNIFLVALLPALGLGITLATLSGQALGAGDKEGSFSWGCDIVKLGASTLTLLALPFFFFPNTILGLFTQSQEVIGVSALALKIMGLTLGVEIIGYILVEGLKGLGYSTTISKISFIWQWLIFIPGVYILIHFFNLGLLAIWIWQIIMHLVQVVIYAIIWNNKKWQDLKL